MPDVVRIRTALICNEDIFSPVQQNYSALAYLSKSSMPHYNVSYLFQHNNNNKMSLLPLMDMIFKSQFLAISCATSLTSAGEKLTLSPGHLETNLGGILI